MDAEILPVGIPEIAAKLGVRRPTVDQWIQRNLLPEPDWTVGGRPAWNWPTIRRWAEETGRIVTLAELTAELALPAGAAEKVARFAGAFETHDPRTGRLPKPWNGQGLGAVFTRAEADVLVGEWYREARGAETLSYLSYGQDPEAEEIAERYRP